MKSNSQPQNLLSEAVQAYQAGQVESAFSICQKILTREPNHADALHLAGVILHQQGKLSEAISYLEKAIQFAPNNGFYRNNLGSMLKAHGREDEARDVFVAATQLEPNLFEAQFNAGLSWQDSGDLPQAETYYRKAWSLRPDRLEIGNNLGNVLRFQNKTEEALQIYQNLLRKNPNYGDALANIGSLYLDQQKIQLAKEYLEPALALLPDNAHVQNSLGILYKKFGEHERSIEAFQRAIALDSALVAAYYNLAALYFELGRLLDAEQLLLKALDVSPSFSNAMTLLANLYSRQGQSGKAIALMQEAVQKDANQFTTYDGLGNVYREQGELKKSLEYYDKALAVKPDASEPLSNRLLALNNSADISPEDLFREHQNWWTVLGSKLYTPVSYSNDRSPNRRLKIGYVSGDFRTHSVAYFIEPILQAHHKDKVEVFAFYTGLYQDAVSARIKALVDHWIPIAFKDDDLVFEQIRDLQIDILVDLSGHTQHGRLPLFARKPAPVQISYLGYPNTTGLQTMDYRFSDVYADPIGTESLCTETLVHLDFGFHCYQPSKIALSLSTQRALPDDTIMLGSFNHLSKLTDRALALWAKILSALPTAKLVLKAKGLHDENVRQRLHRQFQAAGVAPERVILHGTLESMQEHLELYQSIDIALDSFPYNGTTTTFEALWMGVPVVTLSGGTHASRVGSSILHHIGHADWVTNSIDAYQAKVLELAANLAQMRGQREAVRASLQNSTLMNPAIITEEIESAYRLVWQQWVQSSETNTEQETSLLQTEPLVRKLHIGGKEKKEGWEILDALEGSHVDHVCNAMDLSRFADETFAELYASHVVEHLDYKDLLESTLKEWFRVLKKGGKIYISVPDLDVLAKLFVSQELNGEERYHVMRMIFGGHIDAYDYHQVGLNLEFLSFFLQRAGFVQMRKQDQFGMFKDASCLAFKGTLISLNLTAEKPL